MNKTIFVKQVLRGALVLGFCSTVLLATACVKQTISGVQVDKTSSREGFYVKVDSCEPVLSWKPMTYDQVAQSLIAPPTTQSNSEESASSPATQSPPTGSPTDANTPTVPPEQSGPPSISYDVVVHRALQTWNKSIPPDRGERVFYTEGVSGTSVQVNPALDPKTKYFWSVRVRASDGRVTPWTTYDKDVNSLWGYSWYRNFWFGIKTPRKCSAGGAL